MKVSVVVPLYNEEDSVQLLYEAITDAIAVDLPDYEILFVDDGSADATFALAEELAKQDPKLRVLKFRRNYGQTPAMAAGTTKSNIWILGKPMSATMETTSRLVDVPMVVLMPPTMVASPIGNRMPEVGDWLRMAAPISIGSISTTQLWIDPEA